MDITTQPAAPAVPEAPAAAPAQPAKQPTSRVRRVILALVFLLTCLNIVVSTVAIWTHQVAFKNDKLAPLIAWLTLNHGDLTVFIHPNTGQDLEDHRDRAVWIGKSVPLVLGIFTKKKD